jgi:hypothetical protein
MDPHVNHGHGQQCVEAGGNPFPADDQSTVLALEPGKRPLSLEARDIRFDRPPPRLAALPHPCGELGADPASAEALAKGLGVLALIRCQYLHPLAWSAACAGSEVESIQPRDDLGALVPIGWGRARGQRQARSVRAAVDEEPFALPAIGNALTAALARGQKSRRRPHTATESSHVPRPAPAGGLASRPASRPPASAAASEVQRSWTPIGGRAGDHTSDTR